MVWALETSALTLSDTPPLIQSHLMLPKGFQQLGVNYLNSLQRPFSSQPPVIMVYFAPGLSVLLQRWWQWQREFLDMWPVPFSQVGSAHQIVTADWQSIKLTYTVDIYYETQVNPRMGQWSWHAVLGWFNIKTKFSLPFCHIHAKAIDIY